MIFIYLCTTTICYLFIKLIIFYITKLPTLIKQSPLTIYNKLSNMYGGKLLFNILIKFISPYSNSIYPTIEYYDNKKCICSINENRLIKNPFNSIHALALANLGELTSGLLIMERLHKTNRKGIITKINCKYYKKARGKIIATCNINDFKNNTILTTLVDSNKNIVCKVTCVWNIIHKT